MESVGDVFVEDLLNRTVSNELLESLVDFFLQLGVALLHCNGIIFNGILSVEDHEVGIGVGFNKSLCGSAVEDDAVDLVGLESFNSVGGLCIGVYSAETFVSDIPGSIEESGGAGLGADSVRRQRDRQQR